jgi:hypothetical protein
MAEIYALVPAPDGNISGPRVEIGDDDELLTQASVPVVELSGIDSKIHFFTDCNYPYLAFHIKGLKKFMNIIVACADENGVEKVFEIGNKTGQVVIDKHSCKMPLEVGDGWQYICIDMPDMMANAFGASYFSCREVTVSGTCKVSKLYFQNQKYSDVELPPYLRTVTVEN